MPISRTKLVMEDPLLLPDPPIIRMHYSGPGPERFYRELGRLIPILFSCSRGEVQERVFNWDTVNETEKFKIAWEITKPLDKFSYYLINFTLEGSTTKGAGPADMEIEGYLRSEYPQDTMWQKSLFYEILRVFWHRVFYHTRRMRFINDGRVMVRNCEVELKLLFAKFKGG